MSKNKNTFTTTSLINVRQVTVIFQSILEFGGNLFPTPFCFEVFFIRAPCGRLLGESYDGRGYHVAVPSQVRGRSWCRTQRYLGLLTLGKEEHHTGDQRRIGCAIVRRFWMVAYRVALLILLLGLRASRLRSSLRE